MDAGGVSGDEPGVGLGDCLTVGEGVTTWATLPSFCGASVPRSPSINLRVPDVAVIVHAGIIEPMRIAAPMIRAIGSAGSLDLRFLAFCWSNLLNAK
jgi:hypothetical protein